MKITSFFFSIFLIATSCSTLPFIEGFDQEQWKNYKKNCSSYRLDHAQQIIDHKDVILTSTQNEIEALLGNPEEHELYERNQKFFHYRLNPPDSCITGTSVLQFLSIRFNAIGRANLVQVMVREANK